MKLRTLAILAILFMIAVPTFAQAPGSASAAGTFVLPVAFAMAIASGLCGLAQGKAVAAAAEGIARNPGAAGAIRILLLLGLAFIESLSLFTLITVLK
ncbi:MAG: ATP synthase F0 subunit C [Bryobacteraceae bacterium]|jgi:F-type H+-transporting ATPase subunit c|nr:ATP synthase F0 subunit C [Bryobacteraceae bacterium]